MRLWGGAGVCVRRCERFPENNQDGAPECTGESGRRREQHLTLKEKDATLTQETGAIGVCLHCYPINRPYAWRHLSTNKAVVFLCSA